MALQRPGEHLGSLDPEPHPAVLDRGNRGLGNPGELGELVPAESLVALFVQMHQFWR